MALENVIASLRAIQFVLLARRKARIYGTKVIATHRFLSYKVIYASAKHSVRALSQSATQYTKRLDWLVKNKMIVGTP